MEYVLNKINIGLWMWQRARQRPAKELVLTLVFFIFLAYMWVQLFARRKIQKWRN